MSSKMPWRCGFWLACLAAGGVGPLAPARGDDGAAARQPADESREPGVTEAQIAALIEQLGDDDFFARERAQQQLARIGFDAFDALSAAENHDDIEIAARA
ncbi:MAG TPA: hypothetical protein VFU81_15760, partial [Thermomicrobiales bacterium]|nr:hypothetical protein [Thermomicrobiales bacterium]